MAAVTAMLVLGIGLLVFWPAVLSGIGAPIRHLAGIGTRHPAVTVDHVRPAAVPTTVPGPDNTGWQHTGVRLTPMTCGPDGELVIDTDGATLDSALIRCNVRIDANNVTITRSLVAAGGPWAIYKPDQFANLTLTDVEIAGQPGCQAALAFSRYVATRLNIHGCEDGALIDQGATVQDSWIHDFWDGRVNGQQVGEIAHDGVSATGGSDLTIKHNRIDNPRSDDSCIMIGGQFGEPSNVDIEDNYLDGGNYTIFLAPYGTNRVIKNNTFTRTFLTGPADVGGSYVWSGNVYTDGSPVAN
jgi:hypothetical protein